MQKTIQIQDMSDRDAFTTWRLPQDAIARFGQGQVIDLAVSPDGTCLAVGSWVGVWWYELSTCTPITLFETDRGMIDCIALCSATEKPWLALLNSDSNGNQVVKVWNVQTGNLVAVMDMPPKPIRDLLCFSPSGQWLAAIRGGIAEPNAECAVYIWHAATGTLYTELKDVPEEIGLPNDENGQFYNSPGTLTFSHDNRLLAWCITPSALASAGFADFISVWDITTCERIIHLTGHPEGVHSLSFSPCGQFLAAGGVMGTVQVWEASTWQLHQTYPSFGDYLMNVSYAPDGTLRAAGISLDERTVAMWDVGHREKLYVFENWEIESSRFSHGMHLALKSDFEGKVKTVRDTDALSILPWELGYPHSLIFSLDGKTLCTGYRNFGGIVLWDVASHCSQRVHVEPRCETYAVFVTHIGKLCVAGFPPEPSDEFFWGDVLFLWELGQSEPIAKLTVPEPDRFAMAYSPTTNLLACGNGTDIDDWHENDPENGAVYVWDVAHGKMRHIFRGKHTDGINFVKFSPDGTRLISRDTDSTVRLWNVMCGEEIGEFPENFLMHGPFDYDHIEALEERFEELTAFVPQVFSPCGNLIAGKFSDDRILVWDIEQCEAHVTIHIPLVVSNTETSIPSVDPIEFSPCGQYLAYGEVWEPGVEKVPVRLWDIRTGENIVTFLGHPTDIQCLAFSPDSKILASGSFDGTILLWDLTPYL